MALIFLIEDNEGIREAVTSFLMLDDHQVEEFGRLQGVLKAVEMRRPDLIILDVMLPDGDGFQEARRIKKLADIPIMFLTAKSGESERIAGFEVGGDDYVVKPFSPKELALRVRALLKRTKGADRDSPPAPAGGRYVLGGYSFQMDVPAHRVEADGKELSLTVAEWKILGYLASRHGRVVAREQLLGECLDYLAEGSERTIDTHIKNLRAKLGPAPWIETVRGYGYRFAGRPGEEGP